MLALLISVCRYWASLARGVMAIPTTCKYGSNAYNYIVGREKKYQGFVLQGLATDLPIQFAIVSHQLFQVW